jgi:SAM-dependent methyltransferase
MARSNAYGWLARYYDQIFGGMRAWLDPARDGALGRILPSVESACDVACGTGRTALILARRGIRVFAVDLSQGMCRAAKANTRGARPPVRVLRADMRRFRLPQQVDLALCEFDAINHLGSKADLALVARSVSRALKPGGHFYFDVNTRLSFQKLWPGTWWIEKPGVCLVMHGGYDRERDRAWSDLEWFIRNGRDWRRRKEHVEEVCWNRREIRNALREAGFDRIQSWDTVEFVKNNPSMGPGYRDIYLARKAL